MDKRILLPTDFSKNALNAIRYALDLYADQKCDFYLLNAYQVSGYSLDSMRIPEPGDQRYEAAKKDSEQQFDKLLEVLKLHIDIDKHTYHTISTYNSLLEALKGTIAKKDIDIVVMGTKGITGSDAVIFGTNTVNTMEKVTECPVLAIPHDTRFSPPNEIVFPTDYKANFKRRELNYLIEISKMHHTIIRVLHIREGVKLNGVQESNKQLLKSIFEGIDHSFHELSDIKVQKGIDTFIASRESDMIAFINRKHTFFGSLFSKPLVKEMGYYSTIPVLALNEQ